MFTILKYVELIFYHRSLKHVKISFYIDISIHIFIVLFRQYLIYLIIFKDIFIKLSKISMIFRVQMHAFITNFYEIKKNSFLLCLIYIMTCIIHHVDLVET